ncbi:hypothetical protein OIU76_000281, partial [Salix suchowensis]
MSIPLNFLIFHSMRLQIMLSVFHYHLLLLTLLLLLLLLLKEAEADMPTSFPGAPQAIVGRLNWNSNHHHHHHTPVDDDDGDLGCVATDLDLECLVSEPNLDAPLIQLSSTEKGETATKSLIETITETAVLVSPFFFWGTSMVAMKEVLPLTGPFFVSSFRLIPAGLLLVAFAGFKGRPLPSGPTAWLTISLFALVDASCFQGFLAQGLQRTSAGLGSVIIDSQPLTVAILANLLFGESIGIVGTSGLVLGVIGLLLLE